MAGHGESLLDSLDLCGQLAGHRTDERVTAFAFRNAALSLRAAERIGSAVSRKSRANRSDRPRENRPERFNRNARQLARDEKRRTNGTLVRRRAFATMNADRMTADALRALMKHRSHSTTQLYINAQRQIDVAAKALHVPDVLKKGQTPAERFAEQCRLAGFEVKTDRTGPFVECSRGEDLVRLARCTNAELRLLPWNGGWVVHPEG
jgi:hypothetical protein